MPITNDGFEFRIEANSLSGGDLPKPQDLVKLRGSELLSLIEISSLFD
ncbi:hypothetical protein RBSH_04572 [Rhodopirellula baltica SH28]|uniref:Uncharacterized protein n=2 Tax=Rhodopirellula baltica TaxID=265606 RepID=F2AM87_RHOBT|nr:hypothetical protein RBWH47_00259 [Rhodopirellula baltica WH47]EKK00236.1 hypothetical protein RBSH_04572 [Rhodopirellula baltica SH28]